MDLVAKLQFTKAIIINNGRKEKRITRKEGMKRVDSLILHDSCCVHGTDHHRLTFIIIIIKDAPHEAEMVTNI